jgi:hypothetical protein
VFEFGSGGYGGDGLGCGGMFIANITDFKDFAWFNDIFIKIK